jgi:DMSO/TMAO reductase YedYZ heme-binding membrane subunit
VIHYYWLVKSAVIRPLTYGAIVGVLLLWRLFASLAKKKQVRVEPAAVRPLG